MTDGHTRETLVYLFKEKMKERRNDRYNRGPPVSEESLNEFSRNPLKQDTVLDFRKQGEYGAKKNIKP